MSPSAVYFNESYFARPFRRKQRIKEIENGLCNEKDANKTIEMINKHNKNKIFLF